MTYLKALYGSLFIVLEVSGLNANPEIKALFFWLDSH